MAGSRRSRRIPLAAFWLFIALVLHGGLFLLPWGAKLETDILELLPKDDQEEENIVVRDMLRRDSARIVLIALQSSDKMTPRAGVVAAFSDSLRGSGHFVEVVSSPDQLVDEELIKALYDHRLSLLMPNWLLPIYYDFGILYNRYPEDFDEALSVEITASLLEFLETDRALIFEEVLGADPLLLIPQAAASLGNGFAAGMAEEQELLLASDDGGEYALIWARLSASPFSPEGQLPVFNAIDEATATAQRFAPGLEATWSGAGRFAHFNEMEMRGELRRVSILAVCALLLISGLGLGLRSLPHLLFPLSLGISAAIHFAFLVLDEVHVFSLVVASILIGVAVDYGYHLVCHQMAKGGSFRNVLRGIRLPMFLSAGSSVLGFLLLTPSHMNGVRGIGVLVASGLLFSILFVALWFQGRRLHFVPTRIFRPLDKAFRVYLSLPTERVRIQYFALLSLWILLFLFLPGQDLRFNDDIRSMEVPNAELQARQDKLERLFGLERDERSVNIVSVGGTLDGALASLEQLNLALHVENAPPEEALNLGPILPGPQGREVVAEFWSRYPGFADHVVNSLRRAGFEEDAFSRFQRDYAALPEADLPSVEWILERLHGPLASLSGRGEEDGSGYFLTRLHKIPNTLNELPEGNFRLEVSKMLSTALEKYRQELIVFAALGGLTAACFLVAVQRMRGVAMVGIVAFSLFSGWSVLYDPQTTGLFDICGMLLGGCLAVDYAAFSLSSSSHAPGRTAGVRLSAFTTIASFAILATSNLPFIAALGKMVLLIVLTALLLCELFLGIPDHDTVRERGLIRSWR